MGQMIFGSRDIDNEMDYFLARRAVVCWTDVALIALRLDVFYVLQNEFFKQSLL